MKATRFFPSVLFVLSVSILLVNCGTGGKKSAAPEQKVTRIDSLEIQVQQLEKDIAELEERNQKLLAQTKGGQFDIQSQEALAEQVLQLEDRIALLEDRVDFIDSTKFDMLTRLERIESGLSQGMVDMAPAKRGADRVETAPERTARQPAQPPSPQRYKSQYDQAYQLYQDKKYNRAIQAFMEVIEMNSDGDLSDNAQYWIGECYYGMQNFNRAIVEFEKVFTFPNSNKDADAQLKLGLCYLNLGQRQKAREEFQRLIDFYPNSNYISMAREYLQQL